jgi:hypothetical protein
MALKFDANEAAEYSSYFSRHEVEISMIPELNDTLLTTIGINKAGQ